MLLTPKSPAKSLDPGYKLRPERAQIERFKDCFKTLFGHINEKESEENVKDHLMDFLKEVYYKGTFVVAPKGKTDFVIHLGKEASSPAGVLFEVKRPAKRGERILLDNNVDMFGTAIKDPKLVAVEKKRLDKLIEQMETAKICSS